MVRSTDALYCDLKGFADKLRNEVKIRCYLTMRALEIYLGTTFRLVLV